MDPVRKTRSVCPVCLKNLSAELWAAQDGGVVMKKVCPEHGAFSVPVWRGAMDFHTWLMGAQPLEENKGLNCPKDCGLCARHENGSCCTLLEVTQRCNLRCRFCFANGGEADGEQSTDEIKRAISDITAKCPGTLLQLSGGEPSLRDDLPELISHARSAGCSYVQLNTNGIRLAEEPEYVHKMARAGLDIVFLQFDGTNDEIYRTMRGIPLLDTKLKAIETCAGAGLGVVLVPTVVRGINTGDLGNIVRLAAALCPDVKGVHFQPVSYFGRYPDLPGDKERFTLDELMKEISAQTGIAPESFMPSRCDHPLCGFHADFLVGKEGRLRALSSITRSSKNTGCAEANREYVARHWCRGETGPVSVTELSDEMDFDTFLYCLRNRRLTLSAMAFQDAMNLNIERLVRCSLHVYDRGRIKPFCARYLTPMR